MSDIPLCCIVGLLAGILWWLRLIYHEIRRMNGRNPEGTD